MCVGGLRVRLRVPEPQVRERHSAGEDFPPREGAFGRCPLQGQCAASPRVVGEMLVVGEVTFGEPVRHAFGGGCGGVPITFLRGGCVCVVLLGLGQRQRLCIGCGVG